MPDARPSNPGLTSASSTEEENLTGCTPALRRRRQSEKYVTDINQLNLRFQRPSQRRSRPSSEVFPRYPGARGVPSHLLGEAGKRTEESSDNDSDSCAAPAALPPPPPPATIPPHVAENNARYEPFGVSTEDLHRGVLSWNMFQRVCGVLRMDPGVQFVF